LFQQKRDEGVASTRFASFSTEPKWCSASWFARNAPPAFVNMVKSFKIDQVQVPDEF